MMMVMMMIMIMIMITIIIIFNEEAYITKWITNIQTVPLLCFDCKRELFFSDCTVA